MSTLGSYPRKEFSESLELYSYSPSTQQAALVPGSSLVEFLRPSGAVVLSISTTDVAVNENLQQGASIRTSGTSAIGDGGGGDYVVVPAGEGDIPMLNGLELKLLPAGSLAGSDVTGALVTHDGITETVGYAVTSRVMYADSIADLLALDTETLPAGQQVSVRGYHAGSNVGGGIFTWDASKVKAEHDGGTIIDPSKPFPADWATETGTAQWFDGSTATGTGCFVRVDLGDGFRFQDFGADPSGSTNSDAALDGVIAAVANSRSGPVVQPLQLGAGNYIFERGHDFSGFGSLTFLEVKGTGEDTRILYEGAESVFMDIDGEYMRFASFRAQGYSGKTFLRTARSSGVADVDVVFRDVQANSWEYVHHCIGRGSINIDCGLAGESVWTLIESPDPFTPGPMEAYQDVTNGMRRYSSHNLHVDGGVAVFEISTNGPAAEHIHNINVQGVNGALLFSIIKGGHIKNCSIVTGQLINSLFNGAVNCISIRNLNLHLGATVNYDENIPLSRTAYPVQVAQFLVRAQASASTSDLLIDGLTISGTFGPISAAIVYSNGNVRGINVSGLTLTRAWEHLDSSLPALFQVGGCYEKETISVNGLNILCGEFNGNGYGGVTELAWIVALTSSVNATLSVGSWTKSAGFPLKPYTKNRGTVILPSGSTSVTVAHGMAQTPRQNSFSIVRGNGQAVGSVWVSSVTASDVTFSCETAPTSDFFINWNADMGIG